MSYTADTPILGTGSVSAAAIDGWFAARGPDYKGYAPDKTYRPAPANLGASIVAECARYASLGYRVNHDLAAAQILHETAAWQSKYARERNNPGGIGAINSNPDLAHWFMSVAAGVRAHVAHLLVYAVGDGDWSSFDTRRDAVAAKGWLGTAPTWGGLNGKWAYPGTTYGQGIATLANKLTTFAATTGVTPMAAQIPGFKWHPADRDHYQPGRTEKIRGGAQHYTAGTNSLAWLSTTPGTQVSAHFLVKHNPTMEDRGWQLVRIEDTAWTTAFANPYTVAIEYEHKAGQAISDEAYEVLAQTWAEIAWYVSGHQLGDFSSGVRGHKEWVNNPSLTCPDGIDVARIEARRREIMTAPLPGDPTSHLFPETGKTMGGGFFAYWRAHGGLARFGFPITEEIVEDGLTVQYTERARFEHHPGSNAAEFDVMLGLVAVELLAARARIAELEAA